MTGFLLETLAWTAVLIAAVLVLRRPVARTFGPQVAYALWAIPALRLVLPPIELPAWMRPAEAVEAGAAQAIETEYVILETLAPVATADGPAGFEAAAPLALEPATPMTSTAAGPMTGEAFYLEPLLALGMSVWLIGAAIFLYLRFAAYFRLRDELLDGAREVGRDGKVRLIETPGTDAPLAFGVIDKVIALPEGFLAQPDRVARDLALAHEMAHHKGQDLLVNVLVQPLFALHWFNPLGRYGWLALRRDQEAACDARVIASQPTETRTQTTDAYAQLIVSFATASAMPNGRALAAPMACPVLGEKSIIHRLRSLKMNNNSNTRRIGGRLMLGAALIALPLTASISYAAGEAPSAPLPPEAPEAPLPPAPPAPPLAPLAPQAPDAPGALEAPAAPGTALWVVDPDDADGEDGATRSRRVMVIRNVEHKDGEHASHSRHERIRVVRNGEELSEEELEEIMAEMREGLAEADETLKELPRIIEEAMAASEEARAAGKVRVIQSCDGSDKITRESVSEDGTRVIMMCQARVMAEALEGLREAREEISKNREMTREMRTRVLRELDIQIERWEDREG